MEGGNVKTKKKTSSKSTSSNKTRSVKKVVDVSSEQLLEEILNKKKTKKAASKSTTKKSTSSTKSKTSATKRNNKLKDTSNDLLYDQIKLKNKIKKSSTKTIFEAELEYEQEEAKLREKEAKNKEDKKTLEQVEKVDKEEKSVESIVDKDIITVGDLEDNIEPTEEVIESDVDKEITEEVVTVDNSKEDLISTEEKDESYNSLEQSVIRKREQKDDFVEFLTEIENDKLLRDIKAALANNNVEYVRPGYEQSKDEALKKIDNEINERIKNNANKGINDKKTFRLKRRILLIGICVALFVFLVLVVIAATKLFGVTVSNVEEDFVAKKIDAEKLEQEMFEKYNVCLKRPLDEHDSSLLIDQYIGELNQYLKDTYKVSVMYNDVNLGYTYSYNVDKTYYAASTIKSLGAIYLYEKAYLGEINLDDTIVYLKKHKLGASAYMKEVSYGTKVSLRDLVKYSITASDNTAHKMIVDYIGVNNLIEYGKNLGATLTHLGGDLFGYINVSDATLYMTKLNKLINESGELGQELKSYFVNDDQNGLAIADMEIAAAHKYGQYQGIYHDIGIVYSENPYIVTILTEHGKADFVSIIKDINGRIYQLHELYNNNRVTYCENLIYSN